MSGIIFREPYRFFFPLGLIMAWIGVSPWVLYAAHLKDSYSMMFHSSTQTLVYVPCFIIGFLTTFIPRFTQTHYLEIDEFIALCLALSGIVISLFLQQWFWAEFSNILLLIVLSAVVISRLIRRPKSSGGRPPLEMMWVPSGIVLGIIGTILLMIGQNVSGQAVLLKIGKPMMDQGYVFSIVTGVGGFLIPRLLGTYRAVSPVRTDDEQKSSITADLKWQAACIVVYALSFLAEGIFGSVIGYALRALSITIVYGRSGVLSRWSVQVPFYARLAALSAWLFVVGIWLAALLPAYHIPVLHISFIGGFGLMIVAIAGMVILSHAGEAHHLRNAWKSLSAVAGLMLVALILRLIAVVFPDQYFYILGCAGVLWILSGCVFLIWIFPRLFKIPSMDAFGRMHQDVALKERQI